MLYTYTMKRKYLKNSLKQIGYSVDTIKSLMCGRAKPSMTKAIELKIKFDIPLDAWLDIKAYLQSKSDNSYLKQNINKDAQKPSSAEDNPNRQEAV